MTAPTLVDPAITTAWWSRLVPDEAALTKWLQKLEVTERDGQARNIAANEQWNPAGPEYRSVAERILLQTGDDEARHADMIVDVLRARGLGPSGNPPSSIYWARMETHITSLESCCAVFALGERLAAERFQIIVDHPDTPDDIRALVSLILPDENYHTKAYQRLAGQVEIDKMMEHHTVVMAELLKNAKV